MELSGNYTIHVPQELVWKAVNDPHVLGVVVPGSQGFHQRRENEYSGVMKVHIGPVKGIFKGDISLSNVNAPHSYTIKITGHGAAGNVKIQGEMSLSNAENPEHTILHYSGTASVVGRIAGVGQRLIEASAKSLLSQSLESLNNYLVTQYQRLK